MGIFGRITCCLQDVNLSAVLRSGQSFRWVKLASDEWVGPLGRHLWILRQDESGIDFRVLPAAGSKSEMHQDKAKAFIEDYFQLSVSLPDLYKAWSEADEAFGVVGDKLPGVRMLRQDPVENLFCFICSSNNNIQRITSMVEKLCARFGEPIAEYAGRAFHAFPSVSALAAHGVEPELRQLGFGYRARFIGQTAGQVAERGGERWLDGLRLVEYPECHAELRRLFGVGAKVADCVCLMSLDQAAAVPVDTHVHQLAARHYLPELRHVKTLTDRTYRQVADHFRTVFGDRAGWAQAVLFCGDLNEFKKPLEAPVTPKKSTVKSAKTDKKSAKTDKKSAKIDKKSAKTDKKSAKTDKKSAKTDKKSARTDKKSAAKSDAESVTSLSELVPAKRKRTAVVATESTPRTTESTPGTPKGDASVRSCATERDKRRSKRQQNSETVTVN